MDTFKASAVWLWIAWTIVITGELSCGIFAKENRSYTDSSSCTTYNFTADQVIDFIRNRYDKSLRPCPTSGVPMRIKVDMYIISIGSVNVEEMELEVDVYLRQYWRDPKLAYREDTYKKPTINVNPNLLEKIWTPDTHIPNSKEARIHTVPSTNALFHIDPKGDVFYGLRLSLTLTCYMDFKKFPMDRQICYLNFSSYSYDIDEVVYTWKGQETEADISIFNLPQYNVTKIKRIEVVQSYSIGEFSLLSAELHLHRLIFHYLTAFYIPMVLVVLLSWVSFWINPDSTPARVSLGIITILTVSGFMQGDDSSPRVSYIKALDIYMFTSFIFVFASLLEYACVHFSAYTVMKKRETIKAAPQVSQPDSHVVANGCTGDQLSIKIPVDSHENYPDEKPVNLKLRSRSYGVRDDHRSDSPRTEQIIIKWRWRQLDYYSRIAFPMSFVIFNIVYWSYFLLD